MTAEPTRPSDDRGDEARPLFWEAAANAFRPHLGWALYGFGALFVFIGYLGISDESVVAKQLPFLISGGIGGILLAILGAYFLSIEELRRDGGRLDRMEQRIEDLHRALLERPDAPVVDLVDPAGTDSTGVQASGSNGRAGTHVFVVEAGESFHRSDCALVSGKDRTELDRAAATKQGLRPCPVCEPVATAS